MGTRACDCRARPKQCQQAGAWNLGTGIGPWLFPGREGGRASKWNQRPVQEASPLQPVPKLQSQSRWGNSIWLRCSQYLSARCRREDFGSM